MKNQLCILALVLALLVLAPLADGMAMVAPDAGDCPSHVSDSQNGHVQHGHSPDGDGHTGDGECSRDCVLTCALAGLTAGMPALSAFPPSRPERFLLVGPGPWQPMDNRFELFRPPKPLIV